MTAHALIYGFPVVLAISEFAFAAAPWGWSSARNSAWPWNTPCGANGPWSAFACSGGARLYEGIVALMQMTKTIAAVNRLKEAGVPYISILADPATGGAIASYAAWGTCAFPSPGPWSSSPARASWRPGGSRCRMSWCAPTRSRTYRPAPLTTRIITAR